MHVLEIGGCEEVEEVEELLEVVLKRCSRQQQLVADVVVGEYNT